MTGAVSPQRLRLAAATLTDRYRTGLTQESTTVQSSKERRSDRRRTAGLLCWSACPRPSPRWRRPCGRQSGSFCHQSATHVSDNGWRPTMCGDRDNAGPGCRARNRGLGGLARLFPACGGFAWSSATWAFIGLGGSLCGKRFACPAPGGVDALRPEWQACGVYPTRNCCASGTPTPSTWLSPRTPRRTFAGPAIPVPAASMAKDAQVAGDSGTRDACRLRLHSPGEVGVDCPRREPAGSLSAPLACPMAGAGDLVPLRGARRAHCRAPSPQRRRTRTRGREVLLCWLPRRCPHAKATRLNKESSGTPPITPASSSCNYAPSTASASVRSADQKKPNTAPRAEQRGAMHGLRNGHPRGMRRSHRQWLQRSIDRCAAGRLTVNAG